MSDKAYILGVDDEETNRLILEEIFEDDYEFVSLSDGKACLDVLEQRRPDVLLLDVNMPGIDGLETCVRIRENSDMTDLPIIFVSALASPEERMAGYESGGDDYVTKPFDSDELQAKVDGMLKQAKKRSELKESSSSAMSTAMMAMTNASELGLAIRFLQESFDCSTYQELSNKAFEYLVQYGVNGSLFILEGEGRITLFNDGVERPLENAVFEQLHTKGRIYSFGDKFIINGIRASLLVRDLPDDEEKTGRLRDHLAVLLDGIDARLQGIENEAKLSQKQKALAQAIEATHVEISEIDRINRQQQTGVSQELSDIAKNLEAAFVSLGLTDEQENYLVKVVENAEKNTEALYQKGLELDGRFAAILMKLQSVL